jgi:drug/metabolite transporter (DMT)-like permease
MPALAVLALSAAVLWATSFILRRGYRRGSLTPRRFAFVLATGWSLAILIVFFLSLADLLVETSDITLALLGIGIAALNFAVALPIAYFFYCRVVCRAPRRSPPSRE